MYVRFTDFSVIVACATDEEFPSSCGTLICSSDEAARTILIDHACYFAQNGGSSKNVCLLLVAPGPDQTVVQGSASVLSGLPEAWVKKEHDVDLSFLKDADPSRVFAASVFGNVGSIIEQLNDLNFLEEEE